MYSRMLFPVAFHSSGSVSMFYTWETDTGCSSLNTNLCRSFLATRHQILPLFPTVCCAYSESTLPARSCRRDTGASVAGEALLSLGRLYPIRILNYSILINVESWQ